LTIYFFAKFFDFELMWIFDLSGKDFQQKKQIQALLFKSEKSRTAKGYFFAVKETVERSFNPNSIKPFNKLKDN
jgi:hypothetical protein